MKIFNKYYRNLRTYFCDLEIKEFLEVWNKFRKLNLQYHFLKIANFFEKLNIKIIEVPILRFLTMFIDFLRWKIYDLFLSLINGKKFNLYGVTCYCGRQGSGKTIGVIEQLERIKKVYPECLICTNINYIKQDIPLTSWLQLLYLRNGDKGVVFVIDEVQNNGLDWSKFPETLLQVITMQRKQKIKIYLTSQVYKNVVIQLRRQCFEVVECKTFLGRWTRHKCYDADEYNNIIDIATPEKKMKLQKKWKYSFIQSNFLRDLYDTNQIVDTLKDYDKLLTDEKVENLTKDNKRLIYCRVIKKH
mgnify:FL=1